MANSNNATPHHNTSKNNDTSNIILFNDNQSLHCLPYVTLVAVGVDYVYVSDLVVTILNFSFAIFAFLVNLAVIVTIIRTPSLHRPVNALLCGLAAADCLTGLVAQPVHASWRFLLHHIADPCKLVHLYYATKSLPFLLVGCTFLNLTITSMERLYAVFKPLAYSAKITLQGMIKTVTTAWVLWFIYIIVLETIVPDMIYRPMETITMILLIAIPITVHILTFLVIRANNRKIFFATHDSQQAILFKREQKAFRDMTLYTAATLISILPILLLLNIERTFITANILFPWATTITYLVSSFNPVAQIWRNGTLRQALKTTFAIK